MSIISKAQLEGFGQSKSRFHNVSASLNARINESKADKTTIFLSHKHNELKELDEAIYFLEGFGVDIYVDWQDEGMPKSTSGKTAKKIKQKIKDNKKFILLATVGAINSKWCNWELGYGDSIKHTDDNIAILPVKDNYSNTYEGSEYMQIYPSIEYVEPHTRQRVNGAYIEQGFYVFYPPNENNTQPLIPLGIWLKK